MNPEIETLLQLAGLTASLVQYKEEIRFRPDDKNLSSYITVTMDSTVESVKKDLVTYLENFYGGQNTVKRRT